MLYLKNVAANKYILFRGWVKDFNIELRVFIDSQSSVEIKKIKPY